MPFLTAEEVAAEIKLQITKGELGIGSSLEPQDVVAELFGVNRDTLQRAFLQLQEDGFLDERNRVHKDWRGRTKARGAYGFTLAQNLQEVFAEGGDVDICAYCFTSETVDGALSSIWKGFENREISVNSLSVKLLISDTEAPLVVPVLVNDRENPFPRLRLSQITEKHTRNLVARVHALREMGNIGKIHIEIRTLSQPPTQKVLTLNDDRVLTGLYIPENATINGEDAYDLRGWRTPLELSRDIQKVQGYKVWFDQWFKVGKKLFLTHI